MSKKHILMKTVLPLLILAVGIVGTVQIIKMQKPPIKQASPERGLLVDVLRVQSDTHQIKVHATGTVQPGMEISLVPEISGKVSWLSPQMVTGGFLEKGETLLKIDDRDYQLAVDQAKAELARTQVALQTEQQQARIALEEWQRLEMPDKGEPNPLVLHEPQLQRELANLAAAQASLEKAQLNLQRAVIKAPFNCRVRSEQVDPGQYLRAGTSIATLAGTDHVEIIVPLPLSDLQWLSVPRAGQKTTGSLATLSLAAGKKTHTWQGRIVRSLGEIDSNSHMAQVVVAVKDPYRLQENAANDQLDLAMGLFVDIVLHGKTFPGIVAIPREALRENNSVWIADTDDRLQIQPVNIQHRERETLLIGSGLEGGEHLILTTLDGAVEGLRLRPVLQEQSL